MSVCAVDLGATKIAFAVFSETGEILSKETVFLEKRSGPEAGRLITHGIGRSVDSVRHKGDTIRAVGISVPGISHASRGTVWAPNIPEWEDYPLLSEVMDVVGELPVTIDSDRACSILGEYWQGNARGCRDAIFITVGTGIGAGILVNGEVLRGSNDVAGAIGWMALNRPYKNKYSSCGCFEYHASGEGIAKAIRKYLDLDESYGGEFNAKPAENLTSYDVFGAFRTNDPVAVAILNQCIEYWGMAVGNLISLFNPEKIILGGGIFGPGRELIPKIVNEAEKWAQPISMKQVVIESSALNENAALFGAAYLALKKAGG